MTVIKASTPLNEDSQLNTAGTCTQEPGDNCWMHLD